MAVLHLVQGAARRNLELCLDRAGQGDAVLLLGDAVYAALRQAPATGGLLAPVRGIPVHVLRPDLEARGLAPSELAEGVRPVDYDGFVGLTVEYHPLLSWF